MKLQVLSAAILIVCVSAHGARADDVCGLSAPTAKEMIEKVDALAMPKIPSPDLYRAFQNNDERATWTVTTPDHPAYPAVVCRRVIQGGNEQLNIEMQVVCDGAKDACDTLVGEFQMMTDHMRRNLQPRL